MNSTTNGFNHDLAVEYRQFHHPADSIEIALWRIDGDGQSPGDSGGGDVHLLVLTDGPTCLPRVPDPIPCGSFKGWSFGLVESIRLVGGHVPGIPAPIGRYDHEINSDRPLEDIHDQTQYQLSSEAIRLIVNLVKANRRPLDRPEIFNTGSAWRIKRIDKALSLVWADQIQTMTIGIEDHEGNLTVYWKDPPLAAEREIFGAAWESVGECSGNVNHVVGYPPGVTVQ